MTNAERAIEIAFNLGIALANLTSTIGCETDPNDVRGSLRASRPYVERVLEQIIKWEVDLDKA